ncbi:CaiB/BaiF CoA transferase family protein [Ornithinimicrobium murale]|uniref:CaiB/BaiF CoA transferase family protein n=1 Tax=Ornithinimicrobium murale TaxID=1050153 RepID=UPI000E0CF4B3|nr:CoA transferase [Ornithinimicrobium murale]
MLGSLEGIRVVDVTMSVAGPFATQILGDLGADVIKVERPEVGDDTRRWGPPFWDEDESCTFTALNRNKRSVVLDLKAERDREAFIELIGEADVFVQNIRPGSLTKLGLGHEEMRAINPRLIYCDMSGYGLKGPQAMSPAYDPLMQAYGGLMSLNGEEGRAPARIPASILDQGTGMWTAIAVLDALRSRERTGKGAHVHTSLLNTALMWLPAQLAGYFAAEVIPPRLGSGTIGIYPYAAFPTADNWIIIAAGNENLWQRLCGAIDREELTRDPRFLLNPDRVAHREELFQELATTLRGADGVSWVTKLTAAGVPTTPIQTLDQVVADEQVAAIGALPELPHPRIEGFRIVNLPIQVDGEYAPVRRVPPLLGEHNQEVLGDRSTTEGGKKES